MYRKVNKHPRGCAGQNLVLIFKTIPNWFISHYIKFYISYSNHKWTNNIYMKLIYT